MALYFTSDLHLNHNQPFIYKDRGFSSMEKHDKRIISHWNSVVTDKDIVIILGDLVMGGNDEYYKNLLSQLKGNIFFIRGNHDSDKKISIYKELGFEDLGYAQLIKIDGYRLYLSHYPVDTSNTEPKCIDDMKDKVINLYGHTHQKKAVKNIYSYNVGLDAHENYVVDFETIKHHMKAQWEFYFK